MLITHQREWYDSFYPGVLQSSGTKNDGEIIAKNDETVETGLSEFAIAVISAF